MMCVLQVTEGQIILHISHPNTSNKPSPSQLTSINYFHNVLVTESSPLCLLLDYLSTFVYPRSISNSKKRLFKLNKTENPAFF